MHAYEKLVDLYVNSKDNSLDQQTIIDCKNDSVYSIDRVIQQFKFLVTNMPASAEYYIVKGYLETVFGVRIVKTLEEM